MKVPRDGWIQFIYRRITAKYINVNKIAVLVFYGVNDEQFIIIPNITMTITITVSLPKDGEVFPKFHSAVTDVTIELVVLSV